ncbi:MAG: SurA N-terminal domain-containing protein [Bacteroidales bacterium]|nr:SurA N-terminal domain-containing protein [Bacteroidales bacterium]
MSALQTLRNKAGILIAVAIGLALLAFILTDLLKSGQSMFSSRATSIAVVNGVEIPVEKYFTLLENMEENHLRTNGSAANESMKVNFKRTAWDEMIKEAMYNQEIEKLGLAIPSPQHAGAHGVTAEELKDMVLGEHISPVVQQYFTNQETRMYDKEAAKNFLQNMNNSEEQKSAWIEVEKFVMSNRLKEKYKALISKGLYVTTKEAEVMANEMAKSIDFKALQLPYSSLADSLYEVSEKEINDYLDNNEKKYIKEKFASLEYVSFSIRPSEKDFEATQKWVLDNSNDFKLTDNDEQFVRSNSDVPFDPNFYGKGELPVAIDSFAFNANNSKGAITGVYFENGVFKVSKISKKISLPDSVNARHILIRSANAVVVVDSLKKLIEGGADFAMIALQNSEDPGSASKGGDLGWFKQGENPRAVNDTCFLGQPGKLYSVYTEYGVHMIEIMKQSEKSEKVQIATLASKVSASSITKNGIYSKAAQFANENSTREKFLAAIKPEITGDKRIAQHVRPEDYMIPGIENSRQIIKWINEANKEDVSGVFECGNEFIVAAISEKKDKEAFNYTALENEVKAAIIKDKKATQLIAKIQEVGNGLSLAEYAQKLSQQISDYQGVNFNSTALQNLGIEFSLLGVVSTIEKGICSKPIKGNNGVFLAEVSVANVSGTFDAVIEKQKMQRNLKSKYDYSIESTLIDVADIVDNRIIFE